MGVLICEGLERPRLLEENVVGLALMSEVIRDRERGIHRCKTALNIDALLRHIAQGSTTIGQYNQICFHNCNL